MGRRKDIWQQWEPDLERSWLGVKSEPVDVVWPRLPARLCAARDLIGAEGKFSVVDQSLMEEIA